MLTINGNPISNNFDDLIHVSDLIYYEGPLLSHFKNPEGENYLYYWCDVDELVNRWIILRVEPDMIEKYLRKELTLRDLILKSTEDFVYIADIDDNLSYRSMCTIPKNEIPEDYLPHENSYYSF